MNNKYRVKKTTIRCTTRTDAIIHLRRKYAGDVQSNPAAYNRAFAEMLREMADAVEKVKNAWVCPEVVVWMHQPGEITAQVMPSPPE